MLLARLSAAVCMALITQSSSAPYGVDLSGKPITQLASPASTTIVLFFLATDCPVSNRYLPEIQRLQKEFVSRHVSLWAVYPNATETPLGVREHEKSYATTLPVLLDPTQHTTTLTGAKQTPEAAVLTLDHGALKTIYLGRIDNRFVSFGVEHPRATRHDLEDAINAALDHRPIPPASGPTVGCGIVRQQ